MNVLDKDDSLKKLRGKIAETTHLSFNLKVNFLNTRRIKSFCPYKDRLNHSQRSKIDYKASCWDCDVFYKAKTMKTPQLLLITSKP